MSSVSLERGLGDNSPTAVNNDTKMRKEDGQALRETEPFDCIDDVILKLRSIEFQVKSGELREILERLEKSNTLVRRKQDPKLRYIYAEDLMELKAIKAKFDEQLEKMGSNDRLLRKQTEQGENFDRENVDIPQRDEPLQPEIHHPQANEQLSETSEQEEEAIESNPDVQNLLADDDGFLSFSVAEEEPPQHDKPVAMATTVVRATTARRTRSPSEVGMYSTDESEDEQVEYLSCESDTDSISTLRDTAYDILALEPPQPEQHPPQTIHLRNVVKVDIRDQKQLEMKLNDCPDAMLSMKEVFALMNAVTPSTGDEMSGQFPLFAVPVGRRMSKEQLEKLINVIFENAVDMPKFGSLYAELCRLQVDSELEENRRSLFRDVLVNLAQKLFMDTVNQTRHDARMAKVHAISEEQDSNKNNQLQEDFDLSDAIYRNTKLGIFCFIGHLYNEHMFSSKIVNWCLYALNDHTHPNKADELPEAPYNEEFLHFAVQMLEVLGKQLENAHDFNGEQYIDVIMDHYMRIAPKCSEKIRGVFMGLNELRSNNWNQRKIFDHGFKQEL